ncbi:hypothetical protein PC116_g9671 [Phytophthora cactorum]|uniref:Uncharacterized protein n=3 Tax=Phytophthora cactorum TaxID=29920 RepID=A0A329T2P8_9STRA|nr:hypothetical protein PC128_g8428 [Phytophthora cactorum]KAG4242451.1 hypothetical protein PC116_g9671 [Phytophthora cactorum]RAW42930.1 hypothetical protein PC110_g910 [Phytophthora cactorum]
MNCRTIARLVVEQCLPANENALPHVVRSIDAYLTPLLCHEIFTAACEGGASRCILDFLLQRTTPVWKEAAHAAVRGGHLDVIRWMTELQDGRGPWRADFDDGLQTAATQGHLAIVKWLYERGIELDTMREMMESISYIERSTLYVLCSWKALESAAEHGHLEVVQWILTTRTCMRTSGAMDRAVANGHLVIAQWLHTVSCQSCSTWAVDTAAKNGHLEMLQWLQSIHLLNCTTAAMDGAAENGHLEILKWLHQTRDEGCSSTALQLAADNGHLEVVKWLDGNINCSSNVQWNCNVVAERGHLDVLQWLHEHFPSTFPDDVMDDAAGSGRLDVIKWLHEYRSERCTIMASLEVARSGDLEAVKWFHEHYSDQFAPQAMNQAARNGHLHIVRWLHENRGEGCTPYAMDDAAINGHLDVVLYLLEHRNEGFSRFAMASARNIEVQCLFATSDTSPRPRRSHVSNDQLIMLQAVYKRRPAFVKGCLRSLANIALREGNIEILDWLNQLGLHVELHTTIPIRQAVGRGDVKLLQWFYWNEFELHDPDLLHLAVQKEQLDAARWLSKHGFKITSLSLIEEAGRKEMVPMLRWLVEHGPPLDFGTAMKLTVEYFHNEIAWWVSESDRVQIVLEALQKEKQDVLGWILTRTRFENVSSQQRIRDAIQRAPESIILRIEEDLSDLEECKWCFLPTNKRRYSEMELAS